MGTKTLGNTAGGDSAQFYFSDPGSHEVAFRSGDTFTAPEEMYIDAIHCFGSGDGAAAAGSTAGLYSNLNVLLVTTPVFTMGSSVAYYTAPFSAGSFYHVSSGAQFVGAVNIKGGTGGRTWGRNDGGAFRVQPNLASLPTNFGGSVQSGLGNWPWYVSYFPKATITSLPNTPQFPGATIDVYGQSFSAGVTGVTLSGVACSSVTVVSDTHLTCVLPSNATTGPVQVTTNAGTATSAGNLVVSGGRVYNGGTLKSTTAVRIYNGGTLKPVTRIRVYNGGTLKDAH